MRPISLRDVASLGAPKSHGTRMKYMAGSKCLPCRAANSRYECERAKARLAGEWNGLVPAAPARRHLLRLSKHGVVRCAVAAACDVSLTIIASIRSGKRTQVRKRTQDRILGVTRMAVSDAALVPAHETCARSMPCWRKVSPKRSLHAGSAFESPALQVGRVKILARMAARVDRLFRMLMKE